MPDNTESVVYEYRGDVTSLRKATNQAIGFLDSYQQHINRISADGGFGKNVKAARSFQTAVKSVTKDITNMQTKLKSVTDVKLMPNTDVQKQITASLGALSQVQSKLQNATKLTTKEVQALTLQLRGSKQSLQDSSGGVETLIAKEVKFQQTLETVRNKVSNFRDSLDSIKSRVTSAFDPLMNKLNSLRNPFARISQTVQSFRDKTANSFGRLSQIASTVSSAFRRVSTSEDAANSAATRTTKSHNSLSTILKRLRGQFTEETKAIKTEEKSLDQKNDTVQESSKSHSSLGSVLQRLASYFSKETNSINIFNNHLGKTSKHAGLVRNALRNLVGVKLGQWMSEAVKQSISYVENMNLFEVATGSAYKESLKFVDSMAELYGMDPNNLLRYAGNFYQLADAISMPDEASAALSLGLTKATNDIASLYNANIETVFENLSSGMQGMSRAVRKYGMDIRTTTLQQTALSLGITEQVENMSEANRQGLRFITMMQQASNASGDFARTIESPANQLRIFKEQITQLGRAIGDFVINRLAVVLSYINGFVMALRMVLQYIRSILGIVHSFFGDNSAEDSLDNVSDSVSDIGNSAADAAKKLKKMLAPIDELNILQENKDTDAGALSDVGTLDPAILAAIETMQWKLDDTKMKAIEVRDALLSFLGFKIEDGAILSWDASTLEQNLIDKFPKWTKTIEAVFAEWSNIMNGLKSLWQAFGSVIEAVFNRISELFNGLGLDATIADGIYGLADSLERLSSWIQSNSDTLANLILVVAGLVTAFKGLGTVGSVLGPVISIISKFGPALGGLVKVAAIVAAVAAAFALLYNNSEAFATSFKSLLSDLWESVQPVASSIMNLFSTVWQGLQRLWAESIQPMLQQTGDALAPVLDTISQLWQNLGAIFADSTNMLSRLWTSTLEPLLSALMQTIGGLMEIVQTLWETVLGPILGMIGDSFQHVWTQYLNPILEDLIEIIGGLLELILNLWNTVLQPLVNFIVNLFGPSISAVFQFIWTVVEAVVSLIGSALQVLTGALSGVIEFLNGIFTGDWKRALSGLANIFVALGNGILGILESVCNLGVGIINSFLSLIVGAVKGVVNSLGGLIEDIAAFLGYQLNLQVNWTAPQISRVTIPRIPNVALENGGVVTSPTEALVGEGRYDEAVIPLGNSPQMREFADSVADRVNNGEQTKLLREQNELLRQILAKSGTYLDGKLVSDMVTKHQQLSSRALGV